MAQTLCFVVLLSMLMCFASGQGVSISYSEYMRIATEICYTNVTIVCTFQIATVCNGGSLPNEVRFGFTNREGSNVPWCSSTSISPCTNIGTVTPTGSSLPSSCGCVEDDGTHMTFNMTIYPTLDMHDGQFTCSVDCPSGSSNTSGPIIIVVDPCGGCPPDSGCDERELCCYFIIYYYLFIVFCVLFAILCVVAIIWTGALIRYIFFRGKNGKSNTPTNVPPTDHRHAE